MWSSGRWVIIWDAHAKSQVTYSRNYFIKLYGKVLSVVRGHLTTRHLEGAALSAEQAHRSESESSSSVSAASTSGTSGAEEPERPVFRVWRQLNVWCTEYLA